MTIAIADTTVILHVFRKNPDARAWFAAQTQKISITSITWMEVMRGAPGKAGETACLSLLNKCELLHLSGEDQNWAMDMLLKYRLSRGVQPNDCFIAAVAFRLQVPIYTHNVKDMVKILPKPLVVKPY